MTMVQQKDSGGIIKSEMYQMYEITDEMSLRNAIRIICDSIVTKDHRAGITAKHRQR